MDRQNTVFALISFSQCDLLLPCYSIWSAKNFHSASKKLSSSENLHNTNQVWKDTMQDLDLVRTDQSLKMFTRASSYLIHLYISVIITVAGAQTLLFKRMSRKACSRIMIYMCILRGGSVVFRHSLNISVLHDCLLHGCGLYT